MTPEDFRPGVIYREPSGSERLVLAVAEHDPRSVIMTTYNLNRDAVEEEWVAKFGWWISQLEVAT